MIMIDKQEFYSCHLTLITADVTIFCRQTVGYLIAGDDIPRYKPSLDARPHKLLCYLVS